MIRAYYNEFNRDKASWLRELIACGLIPDGDIDTRDIREVRADEIRGYTQYHYFAGIGGWPLAFRLAGWPDDRPVRSASLPCQPYSVVGAGEGFKDCRDLWPLWWREQAEFSNLPLFGEQVADAIDYGWLDRAFDDMEAIGYACAAAVIPACSVGFPHERERVFFVGHPHSPGLERYAGDADTLKDRAVASGYLSASDFLGGATTISDPDGSARLVKSRTTLLDHGLPPPLARLCAEGFGDSIIPAVAAEFIKSTLDQGFVP